MSRALPALNAAARICARHLHLVPLLGSVCAGLWLWTQETVPVENFSDAANHLAMVQWVTQQLGEHHLPFDGWYPYLGLGSSNFHRYQSLPHELTGLAGLFVGPTTAYFWSVYLVLALWPLSVYWGARLLGFERWPAAAAAAVSPVLVSTTCYGFESCTYLWWGLGAWTQLWGMWLLPLTLGLTWRAVSGRGSLALGALALAFCLAVHFLTGYLAGLMIFAWVVVGGRDLPSRVPRAIAVGVGSLLIASWVVVPVVTDRYLFGGSGQIGTGTFWTDSYGAEKVLSWLFSGQLFDSGRVPIVSLLAGAGFLLAAARCLREEKWRAVLALLVISLGLFIGRPSLGWLINLLPFNQSLFLPRYLFGVQLAAVLLAGAFLAWAGQMIWRALREGLPGMSARARRTLRAPARQNQSGWRRPASVLAAAAISVAAVLLANAAWAKPVASEQAANASRAFQEQADATTGPPLIALIDAAAGARDGRVFGGSAASGPGSSYRLGYAPLYTVLPQHRADTIGFTLRVQSMMNDPEAYFDYTDPAQYDLFNIKYVIFPDRVQPPVSATRIADQGGWSLWRVATSGYLEVVDTVWPALYLTPSTFDLQTSEFMASTQLKNLQFPTVSFDGQEPADPTVIPGGVATGSPGSVITQSATIQDGFFAGKVQANRRAEVLLKASFDPRWIATVDGKAVTPQLIAPALVGVPVPPGVHSVVFRYQPISYYPWLFLLALLTLAALHLTPRPLAGAWAGAARRVAPTPLGGALAAGSHMLRQPKLRLPALGTLSLARPRFDGRWVAAGVAAVAAIAAFWIQVAGRGPLVWDEAIRVQAGWQLTALLGHGDLGGSWQWVNQQTFYPFLMPAVHGILMLFGADPLAAAVLPGLAAFALALYLAYHLAVALGAGPVIRWLAPLFVLLIPLDWQLSGTGLTELPGLCTYLALLILLARPARLRGAVAAGLLVAAASWMKWDYGIIAGTTLLLAGLAAVIHDPARGGRWHYVALATALVLAGGLFAVNISGKLQGLQYFTPTVYGGDRDPFYLLGEITTQDGLFPLVSSALLGGVVGGIALWRRRPAIVPAVIFVLVSYCGYTLENNRGHPRYLAPALTVLAIMAPVVAEALVEIWRARFPRIGVSRRAITVGAAVVVTTMVVVQVSAVLQRQITAPDPTAADIVAFASRHMPPSSTVGYIGASNEVSPYTLELQWEAERGQAAPDVQYVPEAAPAEELGALISFVNQWKPAEIIAVAVTPGSSLDTADYRSIWSGQLGYFQIAQRLGTDGCLHQDAATSTDQGRIQVVAWSLPAGTDLESCASR